VSSVSGVVPGRDEKRRGRLASTRRDRSLIFRRKVLALSKSWWCHPKEEDNIWCCLHQQPTPPRPFAQPPLSAKRRKLVFNYSCTHPPFHPLFVSRSFLHGFPRCHHPVHPSPQNLPRTQPLSSPFHLSRNPDERRVYGITRNKTEFICIPEKCIYTYIDTSVIVENCRNRLSPKISSFYGWYFS